MIGIDEFFCTACPQIPQIGSHTPCYGDCRLEGQCGFEALKDPKGDARLSGSACIMHCAKSNSS